MLNWWIGCSGFYYKEWREVFYPKGLAQRNWFTFYCEHFNTLELNVTFYRFPKLSFLQGWYEKSPENFRFSAKVPRLITHYKRFNDCKREIGDFYSTLSEGLQEKLGCILFQMHPRMVYSPEKLEQIIESMNGNFLNVLEFRHESWWNEDVFKLLKKNGITFCSISYPLLPDDVIKTSPVIYYRFHGVPNLYSSLYSETFVRKVKNEIARYKLEEAYLYFNNDIGASAIKNARQLQALTA